MKKYYIVINNVKVLFSCKAIESIGVDLSLIFNKNDKSVDKFLEELYTKRQGIVLKSECVFDSDVFEGDKKIGVFCNCQPLYRDGLYEWHIIFDYFDKKK